MANIKSAKKRILTTNKKNILNNEFKSSMRTAIKKCDKSIQEGNKEEAVKNLKIAVTRIDNACKKGFIKKNTANRYKSRLAKEVNALSGK